jgi:hypothetical protein
VETGRSLKIQKLVCQLIIKERPVYRQYNEAQFCLTYNALFSILRSSKSEFLSNQTNFYQIKQTNQKIKSNQKKRVLIKKNVDNLN